MSEVKVPYGPKNALELPPGTLLRFTDDGYTHPTSQDVRTLKDISGMTGKELCELAGVKNSRTFRRWTTSESEPNHSAVPYAAWRLWLMEFGIVGTD